MMPLLIRRTIADLPRGMFDDTYPTNFTVNVGGWNCRHQLYPVSEDLVPEDVRKKLQAKNMSELDKEEIKRRRKEKYKELTHIATN